MAEKLNELTNILELLSERNYPALRAVLSEMNPADIATVFDEIEAKDIPLLFRMLPKELAADTFTYIDSDMQKNLIEAFSDRELREVINELFMDDTVDLIEEMPANVVSKILRNVDSETRTLINELLNYPKDSAGSIMTTEYVALKETMTVKEAFAHIRRVGVDKETIYNCYVINNRKLVGLVSVKDLLIANYEDKIEDIMETNVISVDTHEDQEVVANMFNKYDFIAIPVVDKENRLVGIVTFDDAMDVIHEENKEDMEAMAAILPSDKTYMKTGVWETWQKRIPWLLLLMVSATFTGKIITYFENALGTYVVLTAFIPMLMGTGGNAGSQSSVTVIRGLSTNEISISDIWRVMWKEFRVSILCGVTLAVAGLIKVILIDKVDFTVALVVSVTLCCTVLVAKLIGCILPILVKKLGFDPAVIVSPFITTAVDAISLLIYFNVATILLGL